MSESNGTAPTLKHLNGHHTRMLTVESGVAESVVLERRYRTLAWTLTDQRDQRELRDRRVPRWARDAEKSTGLLIPMYAPSGTPSTVQWRPDKAVRNRDGKVLRYASPSGGTNRLDVHPHNRDKIVDPTVPLWITEGVKKADALTSRGACVVALTGVFNWRSQLGTLGDWEDVPLRGRRVVVCFDADARDNPNVARAMRRLGAWLTSKGTERVLYVVVPGEVAGRAVKGADDYLAAGGTLAGLEAAGAATAPDPDAGADTFTDARLAETVVDDVLTGRFCWSPGLGWLGWDGRRWAECSDAAVTEDVRRWALDRHAEAAQAMRDGHTGAKPAVDGWRSLLGSGRLRAVTTLARGIVLRDAAAFDADPWALNTPAGILDLRTSEGRPHDPDELCTRITAGSYRPGHTHRDWTAALEALPDPEREWLRCRMGQAATGDPTPDGVLPILQGPGGENGKSLITGAIMAALGDYASPASAKLFLATKGGEHSTEQADLRGQRLMVAEEVAEGRSIDVTALKRIQDVSTIKARRVHKDNMVFTASHSLFATSNYRPVVTETDGGTWRRLALVVFPYRFRKPGEPLDAEGDRRGDPTLKARLGAGDRERMDAVVTWVVTGAWLVAQAQAQALAPTARIVADTAAWRCEADRVAGFWADRLVADSAACVPTADMLAAFDEWIRAAGHHPWPKETFHGRFAAHERTTAARVVKARPKGAVTGLSRHLGPYGMPTTQLPQRPEVYRGVRFRTYPDPTDS